MYLLCDLLKGRDWKALCWFKLEQSFWYNHYRTKSHFPIYMLILSYQYFCLMTSTSGWTR